MKIEDIIDNAINELFSIKEKDAYNDIDLTINLHIILRRKNIKSEVRTSYTTDSNCLYLYVKNNIKGVYITFLNGNHCISKKMPEGMYKDIYEYNKHHK